MTALGLLWCFALFVCLTLLASFIHLSFIVHVIECTCMTLYSFHTLISQTPPMIPEHMNLVNIPYRVAVSHVHVHVHTQIHVHVQVFKNMYVPVYVPTCCIHCTCIYMS